MYRLDEIYQILEVVHQEGLQILYKPTDAQQTEFGFGRVNGILQAVMRFKELLEAAEEERAEKERQREMME